MREMRPDGSVPAHTAIFVPFFDIQLPTAAPSCCYQQGFFLLVFSFFPLLFSPQDDCDVELGLIVLCSVDLNTSGNV